MRGCGGGGVAVSLVTGAACTGCVARGAAAEAATVVGFGIAAGTAEGFSASATGFLATGRFEAAFLRPSPAFTGEGRDCRPSRCALPITALRLTPPSSSARSEEHTSELQSLMRLSYAGFCLNKKKQH